jgi:hypothetical protein
MSNLTTTKFVPVPDLILALDLYNEIDFVSTRITKLERAVKARFVYDSTSEELKRLLSEADEAQGIPVDNFALFAEKGGLGKVVDWLPLEAFVTALDKLREYRTELMQLLYQVTGMSDIMRGQSSGQTTATEQAIKAKFASTRIQDRQIEFARFASDILALKAEIVSKHFSPQTILQRSNVDFMVEADRKFVGPALSIIKSNIYQYRIAVKPEAISMQDYAAVRQERGEVLTAVATYLQSALPVIQAAPVLGPMLLQMLQWAVSGFRGGSTIEGAIDQSIAQFQQMLANPQPQGPNPEQVAAEAKAKADIQKTQLDAQVHVLKARTDIQKAQAQQEISNRKLQSQLQAEALRAMLPQNRQPPGEEGPANG